jgi:hypothetical protein
MLINLYSSAITLFLHPVPDILRQEIPRPEPSSPKSVQARLAFTRKQFWAWTREWESIDFFDHFIRQLWDEACSRRSSASTWERKLITKLKEGREILHGLRSIESLELPSDLSQAADLWRQACDLLFQINRGLALIEVWLEVMRMEYTWDADDN